MFIGRPMASSGPERMTPFCMPLTALTIQSVLGAEDFPLCAATCRTPLEGWAFEVKFELFERLDLR